MKDQYELTVIISNYNQEKHLSETIDSVFGQDANFPFKVIIADDCSHGDQSKEIIRAYADKYDHIEAIFAEENGGYLTNVLRAKAKAKTKYLCLLDADDYWTDRCFLQRAYDFLEAHEAYAIYEANVEVVTEGQENNPESAHPFVSPKIQSGTYSKEMLLNNQTVPITQTTGMFLRNTIFIRGIPEIMIKAIGTRSERSFEGDTGRFIMHLKEGPAYYDRRIVGVYRLTENGIWNHLAKSKKKIITARMQMDYYEYYGLNAGVFVNRAYKALGEYLQEKQRELAGLEPKDEFMDEEERLMAEDVYRFCKLHEDQILRQKNGMRDKAREIYRILRN